MVKPKELSDSWFFADPHPLLRILLIYVKGDAIVLIPIWIVILITGLLSWQFMLLEIGLLLTLRGIGEMVYWLLQQFGDHQYRPYSLFKNLNNNGVYILYQLSAMASAFFGLCLILFTLLYCFSK